MGGGGGSPGTGRDPPMPGGQPVSISRDLPSGVTNSSAVPPSTSNETIFSAGGCAPLASADESSCSRRVAVGPRPQPPSSCSAGDFQVPAICAVVSGGWAG